MAYLCPVCEEPQVDAGHLANHLAFTALIRGGDHEAWLDEHEPGWDDHDESWLADRVRETLEAVDHPVDEIETGGHGSGLARTHDHGHGREHDRARGQAPGRAGGGAPAQSVAADELPEEDAQSVVEEARELTRRMADSGKGSPDEGAIDDRSGDGEGTAEEDRSGDDEDGSAEGEAETD